MDVEEGVLLSELITNPNAPPVDVSDNSSISRLDSLLKCGICYEYFDTCVITDCSHNFCSLCIRRYIQYKTECPVCFKELYDSSLRANRIVDEFKQLFPEIKDRFLRCLRTINSRKPNCVLTSPAKNVDDKTPKSAHSASYRSSDMPGPRAISPKSSPTVPSVAKPSETLTPTKNDRVLIPKMFFSPMKSSSSTAEKTAAMQECPVCNVFIPERNMNRHLDECLQRGEKASKAKSSPPTSKRTPLPKLVFRLLTSTNLRNKAKEYGLNPQGDNETLKVRIQKYTALYNAECDKPNPRPVSDLIRQLEKEEKMLTSQKLPKNNILAHFDQTEKSKLNAQYLKENKKSFEGLIEKMKNQQASKKSAAKSVLLDDYCQPSTSKTHFDVDYAQRKDDMLEIDEMKVEKKEKDSQNVESAAADKPSSEEEDVFNPMKRKTNRGKRLDFENSPQELDAFDIGLVKFEPGIYEALTDDENERSFGKDNSEETDNMPGSPVIAKSTRRKRRAGDEPLKKSLRKKKR